MKRTRYDLYRLDPYEAHEGYEWTPESEHQTRTAAESARARVEGDNPGVAYTIIEERVEVDR